MANHESKTTTDRETIKRWVEERDGKPALKKLGFRHEGRMIDCEIKNGNFISLDVFALLNPD